MNRKTIYLLLFISNVTFAQSLQKYNGKYEDNYGGLGEGIAEYTYYENDDYERIMQGKFLYSSTYDFFAAKTSIIGFFTNNKKSGKWSYKKSDVKFDDKYLVEIIGSYLDGKKNGKWTFNQNNEKFYNLSYKNDTLIGDVNLKGLTGKFDKNGKFIGKWTLKDGDYEFIAEFQNNVLTKLIERKTSSGKLYCKYTPELNEIELSKTKKISGDIYGLSNDSDVAYEQQKSFRNFFKELKKRILDLQNRKNDFILFGYYEENEPEFYIN